MLRIVYAVAYCAACLFLFGCASTQLNYNTLDLGESVSDLQKKQVLYNLSLFIDDPAAFPTHLDLQSGTAQTTNTIQPTVGVPLAATHLAQIAASTAMGGNVSSEIQGTRPGWALSVEGQNAQQQNWSYQPIVDGKELLRLRALYRYADGVPVRQLDGRNFLPCDPAGPLPCTAYSNDSLLKDFPIFRKSVTVSYSNIAAAQPQNPPNPTPKKPPPPSTDSGNIYCPDMGLYSQPSSQTDGPMATCSSISTNIETPDENTLHYPNCILCLNGGNRLKVFRGDRTIDDQLYPNKVLQQLNGARETRWLYKDVPPEGYEYDSLGHYGRHDLFIATKDRWKLSEFTLFVLMATAQSSAESASSSGGGGGGGGGGANKKGSQSIESAPSPGLN